MLVFVDILLMPVGVSNAYSTDQNYDSAQTTQEISRAINDLARDIFRSFSPDSGMQIIPRIPMGLDTTIPQVGQDIELGRFFTPQNISTEDIVGAIKAFIGLFVNLLFIVIRVVIEVLKGLLGAVNTA